jgi:hypothetical protein
MAGQRGDTALRPARSVRREARLRGADLMASSSRPGTRTALLAALDTEFRES